MSQPQLQEEPGAEGLVGCPWCRSSKANRALSVPKKKGGSTGGILLLLENVLCHHVWEGQGLLLCSGSQPFILG